ncbi:MAG: rhodanese-like domain-containing protein [Pseudomonadota bacterium]
MMKGIAILLGVAAITALTVNHLSSRGIALVGNWDTEKGVISAKSRDDVVVHEREIGDIQEVKKLYDRGGVVFLDARSVEAFAAGHISGAISLPVGEAEGLMEVFLKKHPADTHFVTYCSGRECDDSHRLAELMTDYGYTTVQVFVDGFPAWEGKGYPVE